MQLPSPPQRRLSRSSIDLRDLEQQQHEKVTHTDSAPSIIVTDNYSFDIKKKSANSLQPLLMENLFIPQPEFLNSAYLPASIDSNKNHHLDILRDDDQLARFIEDNFFYFKKQSSQGSKQLINDMDAGEKQQNRYIAALSESDFLTYQNSNFEWNSDDGGKIQVVTTAADMPKQKITACSDSDFIISYGNQSKKLSLKSRLRFARTILTGGANRNAANKRKSKLMLQSPAATIANNNCTEATAVNKAKFGMLSKSCNGCYKSKSPDSDPRCLQRVLSEGNNKTTNDATIVDLMDVHATTTAEQLPAPLKQQTAVDIFLKLIDFDKKDKKCNIIEEPLNNFNYELAFNRKYENYCDQLLLLNLKTDNCLKMNSLCDISVLQQHPASPHQLSDHHPTPKFYNKMSKSEQLVLVNQCVDDRNSSILVNSAQSSCNNLYNMDHVFVNSFVINSPPPPLTLPTVAATHSATICSAPPLTQHNDCNSYFTFSPTIGDDDDKINSHCNLLSTQIPLITSPVPSTTVQPPPPLLPPLILSDSIIMSSPSYENRPSMPIDNDQSNNISLIVLNEDQNVFNENQQIGIPKKCNNTTSAYNNNNNSASFVKKERARNRQSSVVTYDINVINNTDDINGIDGTGTGYTAPGKPYAGRQSTSSASKHFV